MTITELIHTVETAGIFLPLAQITALFDLKQQDYDTIVLHLLQIAGPKLTERRVDACVLFAIRPNKALYPDILNRSLDIGDPSSSRDGVVALLQAKSADRVAADLLDAIDPSAEQRTACLLSMFYWMGFSPTALITNRTWPGYAVGSYLWYLREKLSFERANIVNTPITPEADPEYAEQISLKIMMSMLDLFEENSANQIAREAIALLMPNPDYPDAVQSRLKHMYELAKQSTDEYVRQRVGLYDI
jgi:hypothetical protein